MAKFFKGLFGNPMIMFALASAGKEGRIAAAILKGVDKTLGAVKKERQGEIDFLSMSLAVGESVAEAAQAGGINVINDQLKNKTGMSTVEALDKLKKLKESTNKGSIEQIKLAARLAAAQELRPIEDDGDD